MEREEKGDGEGPSYIARDEVEMLLVELERLGEVGCAYAEVAQLMHGGRPLLEALELVDASVLLRGLYEVHGVRYLAIVLMKKPPRQGEIGDETHVVHGAVR